jgi:hypothetical protein
MNSEVEQAEYPNPTPTDLAEVEEATNAELGISMEPGTLSKLPSAKESTSQQTNEQLSLLVERLNEVFSEYRQPITTIGVALAAIPFIVLTVSLLRVINAIPLFSSTFELIGFGFTSWFVYRYLLFAESRQELSQEYQDLKQQILGTNDSSV